MIKLEYKHVSTQSFFFYVVFEIDHVEFDWRRFNDIMSRIMMTR